VIRSIVSAEKDNGRLRVPLPDYNLKRLFVAGEIPVLVGSFAAPPERVVLLLPAALAKTRGISYFETFASSLD
jgi:hypothetical protein